MKKMFLFTFLINFVIFLYFPTDFQAQIFQANLQNYTGSIWGYSFNSSSELGDGTTTNKREPIQIGKDENWIAISAGQMHTFAIKRDGTLWGCGKAWFGDGTEYSKYPIIKQIGTDKTWRCISTNIYHSIAIKNDGSMWSWGDNNAGQLGDSTLNFGEYLTPIRIEKTWNDVIIVSAGQSHSAAIRDGGTLYMWGSNSSGKLGDGTQKNKSYPIQIGESNEWDAVSCGDFHTLAIKKNGTLWAWGGNIEGCLGIEPWEKLALRPTQVGKDSDWVSVSACTDHSLGLKSNGTLWAWGSNIHYGLGDSTKSRDNTPSQIGIDSDWELISAGFAGNAATKRDGSIWKWGEFAVENGEDFIKIPTKIKNIQGVIKVTSSDEHTMFIRNYVYSPPTVVTLPVTSASYTTVESGGNITSDGGNAYVTRGVCYSTSPDPTINDNITEDGRGFGEYSSRLTNLKLFETYYVRAWAKNEKGLAYGQEEVFKVNLQKPLLLEPHNDTTNIPRNATLNWNKVDSALKYRVQIAANPEFDSPILDEETVNTNYGYDKYENNTT